MAFRSQTFLWIFVLCFLSILRPVSSKYLLVPGSTKSYGPDGPWNAFSILVGDVGQNIDLYMGGTFSSAILSASICNFKNGTAKESCPARDFGGGVYNSNKSSTSNTTAISITNSGAIDLGYGRVGGLLNITGSSKLMMDRLVVGDGPLLQQVIRNTSINRIDEATQILPGGGRYDLQVSFLSMGASDSIQVFGLPDGRKINATIPVNQLVLNGATGSRSWGMHVGSAQLQQPGSLILGGYDRSRVVSDPATFDIKAGGDLEVVLQNITFGVMRGASPWGSTPQGNMLISDAITTTSAANTQISAILTAVSPYLYLPQNTCSEIAKYLPVTFAPSFGLYLWNINDPKFALIVNSTAYIQFGFSYRGGQYPVKIPMKLLALQLVAPFPVTSMTTYFPCQPVTGTSPAYFLGRSFLQGAFIGLSWSTNKFWLAQAPGPAMSTSDIYDINPNDATITAMANVDWAASWNGVLKVDGTGTSDTDSAPNTTGGPPPEGSSKGGSSTGGIVGGVVGGLAVLLIVAAAVFFVLRRRKQNLTTVEQSESSVEMTAKQPLQEEPIGLGPVEADTYTYNPPLSPVELDGGNFRDQYR